MDQITLGNNAEITKEKLSLFVACGKYYINANQANKSLLWICIDSLLELGTKKLKKIERERDFVRMKFCKKTGSKHIEYDKRGSYQFTEEDNKKVLEEFDRIDSETLEFPTMIVPKGEYPVKGLSYDLRQAFKGIVIPANEYDVSDPNFQALLDEENKIVAAELEEESNDD